MKTAEPWRVAAYLLLALLLAALVSVLSHSKPDNPQFSLDNAVFLPGAGGAAPPSVWAQVEYLAGTRSVSLPHDWRADAPDTAEGWYFVALDADAPTALMMSLWIPRVAMNAQAFLNGAPLARRGRMDKPLSRNWNRSWLIQVPASLLNPTQNLLALRVVAERPGQGMLRELYFGPDAELRGYHELANFFSQTLVQMIVMLMLVTSAFMALLWWWGRHDATYGWYAIMLFTWAIHDVYPLVTTGQLPPLLLDWFWHVTLVWFVYSVCIFVFRYLQRDEPELEIRFLRWALSVSAALTALVLFAPAAFYDWGYLISDTAALLISAYPLYCVLDGLLRRFTADVALLVTCGAFSLTFGIHDWMVMVGILDRANNYLMPFGSLSIMLVFGFLLVRRFGAALEGLEAMNLSLEQRVRNREQEVERAHQRLLKLETERAISHERERLVRDMHDGLGGTLISTLAMVRSGSVNQGSIQEALQAAIEDMRLMIDSLDPVDGDLVSVLASLRSRLAPRLEAAGLTVQWRVTEVPAMNWLGPQGVLGVMRILQEGINNVLKHAQASSIEVACGLDDETSQIWVRLSDDGGTRIILRLPVQMTPSPARN